MSGETESQESGWTVDTLKYLVDERQRRDDRYLQLLDRLLTERWQAQEVASKRAIEVGNEFRQTLDDLSSKQATKVELESAVKTLTDKIDTNTSAQAETRSRLDVGPAGLAALQTQQTLNAGIQQGSQITMGKIYAAIAAVGTIVSIVVVAANSILR